MEVTKRGKLAVAYPYAVVAEELCAGHPDDGKDLVLVFLCVESAAEEREEADVADVWGVLGTGLDFLLLWWWGVDKKA